LYYFLPREGGFRKYREEGLENIERGFDET